MRFTVKPGSDALCLGCKHLFQIKLREENEERWFCTNYYSDGAPFPIPGTVVRCTDFSQKNSLSLSEMKEVAWYIRKEPAGNIGFLKPGDKNYPGNRNRGID